MHPRIYGPQSQKYLLIGPFQKKFANSWCILEREREQERERGRERGLFVQGYIKEYLPEVDDILLKKRWMFGKFINWFWEALVLIIFASILKDLYFIVGNQG